MQKCSPCRELPLNMIEQVINDVYAAVKDMKGGENASYIPYLAHVNPGLFGIAAFAPPLDEAGNSVKAQAALQYIMEKLNLSIFSGSHICQIA